MIERGFRHYPIGLFASVMGVAGVGMAFQLLEGYYGLVPAGSIILTVMAAILFLLNGGILLYRYIKYREEVLEDFRHPVKMNFFAAVPIGMHLLAALIFPLSETFSFVLWVIATVLQLCLTLIILGRLIWVEQFKVEQFNPTWFIPIVANIVVPLIGVEHADVSINWLFFGLGILFSIVYMTIFIFRIFFYPPLPQPLLPTFVILIVPPSIGMISYVKLTGEFGAFSNILYGIAFYLGLLLLSQAKRFMTIPFTVAWWGYLFPTAAVTNATMYMFLETGKVYYHWLFLIQIAGLVVLTLILLWKTFRLWRS